METGFWHKGQSPVLGTEWQEGRVRQEWSSLAGMVESYTNGGDRHEGWSPAGRVEPGTKGGAWQEGWSPARMV
jgi:hypothetical protein